MEWIAGLVFFLALCGLFLRVVFGLRRPQFWVYAGLVVFLGLPFVFALIEMSRAYGLGFK